MCNRLVVFLNTKRTITHTKHAKSKAVFRPVFSESALSGGVIEKGLLNGNSFRELVRYPKPTVATVKVLVLHLVEHNFILPRSTV